MWEQLVSIILQFGWRDVIDIALIAFVLYKLIILIRGTRAVQLLKGLILMLIITVAVRQLGLTAIDWLLRQIMTIGLIAIPIVFQPELRRGLEQLGRGKIFLRSSYLYGEKDIKETI
ncbi:MAG: TIGR00159 family protein, partial [Firmicutes bacterium HGW-Firmicutes-13]